MAKRLLDLSLSLVSLVFLTPLLLAIALAIKLDSPGPALYRGARVGRGGKGFRIFKFRTMVQNAERMGGPSTRADDPRITRVGRVLRKFNLDELPQLMNVLRGDMSIVGPRPEVPQYVALFTDEEKAILSVRPGITGWGTLWVRDEGKILADSDDTERAYFERIWSEKHRLELEYVRKRSLWVDIQVIGLTLKTHLLDRFRS